VLLPLNMNSIAKILTLIGLSSLVLLLPFPIIEERGMTLLEADAIAQENSASLSDRDLDLLAKAIENFFSGYRYATESQISLAGQLHLDREGEKVNVTIQTNSKIIIDTSPQFRSLVTFKNDLGESQQEYEFISNGERVWIYDKTMSQYAILTLEQFLDSDHYITLGLSSFLFIQFSEAIDLILLSQSLPEDAVNSFSVKQILQSATADGDFPWRKIIRQENEREYYIYTFNDPDNLATMSFWIDPETASLYKISILGEEENRGEFIWEENIIRRQEIPESENITFQFIPSGNVEQVETINLFDFES
jgi:outer membrane lipoprotein-sorting protein